MRVTRWGIGAVVAAVLASPAAAQFVQYTAPGSLGVGEVPTKERLEKAMESARWHLGGLRVAPWFGIRNATYYDDVLPDVPGKQSDLTVTAGAGVAAFLPVGSKIVVAGHALPEYQWWRDLANRRTWNGRYGVGVAGYFNRLTVEAFGARNEEQQYASSESELPVNVREDRGRGRVELEVLHGLFLYASGTTTSWRYSSQDLGALGQLLVLLDRDETETAGGIRWELGRTAKVSVGAKRVDVDFVRSTFNRSSRGNAPTIALLLGTERMGLDASAARFDIKPVGDSAFAPYRGTTGKARVWRELPGGSTWTVYGGRDLGFSTYSEGSGYYVQQRIGTSVAFPLGWRTDASVYYESGSLDYAAGVAGGEARTDDFRAYGLRARILMARSASLVFGVSKTSYDSNVVGADRSYTRIQTGVVFGLRDPAVW